MRETTYTVIVDGRYYSFGSGAAALEFAHLAARHILKRSWEKDLPEITIKIVPVEPEPEEEELRCDEELERVCEA